MGFKLNFTAIKRNIETFYRFDELANQVDVFRAWAVLTITFLTLIVQAVNMGTMYVGYGQWSRDHWVGAGVLCAIIPCLFILRYVKVFPLYVALMAIIMYGGTISSSLENFTGINSALLPLLGITIVFAGLISGWRMVLVFGVSSILVSCILYQISLTAPAGSFFDLEIFGVRNFQRVTQACFSYGLITAIIALFSHAMHTAFGQLENNVKEAQGSDLAKSVFLSNMSHEIRTPLNGIIGMSGLLLNSKLDEKQHQYAEIVNSCGKGLVTIINDVLDISKMDAQKFTLKSEPFNLYTLLNSLVLLHSPAATNFGLDLSLRFPKHLPNEFIGDEGRLRQVINNLIGNAMKFTEEGSVTVFVDGKINQDGDFGLYVAVKDTGIGINTEDIHKVFMRFEQIDSALSRQHAGTGLGLSIAKEIIECMGGTMHVASKPNKGSVFYFNVALPITKKTARPSTATALHTLSAN